MNFRIFVRIIKFIKKKIFFFLFRSFIMQNFTAGAFKKEFTFKEVKLRNSIFKPCVATITGFFYSE